MPDISVELWVAMSNVIIASRNHMEHETDESKAQLNTRLEEYGEVSKNQERSYF